MEPPKNLNYLKPWSSHLIWSWSESIFQHGESQGISFLKLGGNPVSK